MCPRKTTRANANSVSQKASVIAPVRESLLKPKGHKTKIVIAGRPSEAATQRRMGGKGDPGVYRNTIVTTEQDLLCCVFGSVDTWIPFPSRLSLRSDRSAGDDNWF